jgi:hypothetical protein
VNATKQPLPVIVEQVPDGDDEPVWAVTCPHCRQAGAFREVDQAVRWNTAEQFDIVDGVITAIGWSAGEVVLTHVRYECEHCGGPVLITAGRHDYQI